MFSKSLLPLAWPPGTQIPLWGGSCVPCAEGLSRCRGGFLVVRTWVWVHGMVLNLLPLLTLGLGECELPGLRFLIRRQGEYSTCVSRCCQHQMQQGMQSMQSAEAIVLLLATHGTVGVLFGGGWLLSLRVGVLFGGGWLLSLCDQRKVSVTVGMKIKT